MQLTPADVTAFFIIIFLLHIRQAAILRFKMVSLFFKGKSIKILWHFTRCRINSRGLMGLNFEWKSYTCQIQARNS